MISCTRAAVEKSLPQIYRLIVRVWQQRRFLSYLRHFQTVYNPPIISSYSCAPSFNGQSSKMWITYCKHSNLCLLTVIGLEIRDKLLVVRDLSCRDGYKQDVKGPFSSNVLTFDNSHSRLTFCNPDFLKLDQILKKFCKTMKIKSD